VFDLDDDPTRNNVAWYRNRAQDIETIVLMIRVSWCSFWKREKLCCRTLYFSLIIVKSLQFRGRRQIAESRKCCLVRVIIFLWHVFFLYFVSYMYVKFVLIFLNPSCSSSNTFLCVQTSSLLKFFASSINMFKFHLWMCLPCKLCLSRIRGELT